MSWNSLDSLLVFAGVLMLVACAQVETGSEPADLVLRGGRVVTVDEDRPEAEALAVRDSMVVAVGSDDEIEPLIGSETRVIELDGRLVIPGLIEGHGHYMSLGESKTILDLTTVTSWDEIVAMVEQAVADVGPGEWIRGRGWHQEKWVSPPSPAVDGSPVHTGLSAVSPDNPVLLGHASGHAAFANAKALELAGIDNESANPPGGELVRDAEGRLTGLLREKAQSAVRQAYARSQQDRSAEEVEAEQRRWIELAGREALAKGVTSFQDAGSSFETIGLFKTLEEEGSLPVRLYVMVRRESNEEMGKRLPEFFMPAEGNDFLTVRSIKRQSDGALGAHGAWLLEPYTDMPESVGLVLEPEDEIRRTAEIAIEHGYQVNTHAIGDRANRRVLDIYQEVFEANGSPADLRWRVEHAQHLDPADVGRFAELGVIAAMQGIHCTSDGPWVPERLGDERTESGSYLWRSLIDSGAVVTNGTDVPVEDIDPLAGFYASVTRKMVNGELFYPEQKMTRAEALKSYTLDNAFAAFEEDLKGSLVEGKLADMTVFSKDIMTIPAEEIPTAEVDLTIVGGEIRFER
jgi:predicted amidohydrolase YtcJ